jgi:hypothetical protein
LREHVEPADREQFREVAESELLNLHAGNFARYQIRPSEFHAWQKVWATAIHSFDYLEAISQARPRFRIERIRL